MFAALDGKRVSGQDALQMSPGPNAPLLIFFGVMMGAMIGAAILAPHMPPTANEPWFATYQDTIVGFGSSLIAVGAAIIAWRSVRYQIAEERRARAHQETIATIGHLETEIAARQTIYEALERVEYKIPTVACSDDGDLYLAFEAQRFRDRLDDVRTRLRARNQFAYFADDFTEVAWHAFEAFERIDSHIFTVSAYAGEPERKDINFCHSAEHYAGNQMKRLLSRVRPADLLDLLKRHREEAQRLMGADSN